MLFHGFLSFCPGRSSEQRHLARVRHAGERAERAQLLEHVWDYDFAGDARVLETYVSYLRKKLDTGFDAKLIHTVRGVGYCIRED